MHIVCGFLKTDLKENLDRENENEDALEVISNKISETDWKLDNDISICLYLSK